MRIHSTCLRQHLFLFSLNKHPSSFLLILNFWSYLILIQFIFSISFLLLFPTPEASPEVYNNIIIELKAHLVFKEKERKRIPDPHDPGSPCGRRLLPGRSNSVSGISTEQIKPVTIFSLLHLPRQPHITRSPSMKQRLLKALISREFAYLIQSPI